jgi:hypothetical protein
MWTAQRRRLTEPLGGVTAFLASFLLLSMVIGVVLTLVGVGSIGGFGRTSICVNQPHTQYGDGNGSIDHLSLVGRHGASISLSGTLQACINHPGLTQRIMYTLTTIPGLLFWACVLLLLYRLIVSARRAGPFTVQVATAMRRLGWLIIVGSVAAAVVQAFDLDLLLNSMVTGLFNSMYADVIWAGLGALFPVPALTGAALLTMARIVRLGAEMDDEIKGTV